jgi:hypothetical protein
LASEEKVRKELEVARADNLTLAALQGRLKVYEDSYTSMKNQIDQMMQDVRSIHRLRSSPSPPPPFARLFVCGSLCVFR